MPESKALARWLDAQFERAALDAGAQSLSAAETIDREVLERSGYFEAFPGIAIPATADSKAFFPPAACYHVYAGLERQRLEAPRLFTLAVTCGREEEGVSPQDGRLRRFRMREVVFLGPPEWVARNRDGWMDRGLAIAASLGLGGEMQPATDLFFGDAGRGRRLMQQMKNLKFELRMKAGPSSELAVASFNLHESFFTERFDIRMADGSPAASGCAAFGVDRWALAYIAQGHAHLR